MGAAPNNDANNTPTKAAGQIGKIQSRENFLAAAPAQDPPALTGTATNRNASTFDVPPSTGGGSCPADNTRTPIHTEPLLPCPRAAACAHRAALVHTQGDGLGGVVCPSHEEINAVAEAAKGSAAEATAAEGAAEAGDELDEGDEEVDEKREREEVEEGEGEEEEEGEGKGEA